MILRDRKISSWYRATTPIRYPGEEDHATGFFYTKNGETYLITNRHVFYDINTEGFLTFNPDTITIRVRDSHQDYSSTTTHRIPLYDEDEPRWLEHPNWNVDVAGLPLEIDWDSNANTSFNLDGPRGLPISGTTDEKYGFLTPEFGDSAVVMGYPILDSTDYLPVLRNALIASQYGRFHRNMPYFLIDANLHPGTSGSPVIYTRRNSEGKVKAHLLGVHSGNFDMVQEGSENLNRVWYRKTILELFGEFLVQHSVKEF